MLALRVVTLFLLTGLGWPALAEPSREGLVDALLKEEMARQRIPGVSIAVLHQGEVVFAKGYGLANLELGVEVTPETVFKIASVSKQFIATAVMLLVQDGKLGLDDSLAQHFDEAPDFWKSITLRHLLSHTSGLQRELPGWDYLKTYSDAEIEAMAKQAKSEFAPRERYQYSNTGYFLLGLIVNKVAGKPWGDFLHERAFQPLGMGATRPTTWRDLVPHRASGYDWNGSGWTNDRALLSVRTSGAFLSSAKDLATWESALVRNRVLTAASLRQMSTPTRLADGRSYPYGLGWNLEEYRGRRVMGHGGALLGFRSHYLRLLDDGLAVVVLANSSSANAGLLAHRIALRWLPELDMNTWKPETDSAPSRTLAVRDGLARVVAGEPFGQLAHPDVAESLRSMPESSKKALADRLEGLTEFSFLREYAPGGTVIRGGQHVRSITTYRMVGAGSKSYLTVYWNAEGRLIGIETSLD